MIWPGPASVMRWYNASGVNTTRVEMPVPQIRHRIFFGSAPNRSGQVSVNPVSRVSGGKRATSPVCSETGTVQAPLRLIFFQRLKRTDFASVVEYNTDHEHVNWCSAADRF